MSDKTPSGIAPAANGEHGESRPAPVRDSRPRRWDPMSMLADMESEMDRLFGRRVLSMQPLRQVLRHAGWTPQVDIYEKDNAIVVKAELPGVNREDIDVSIEDNDLVIRGERHAESEVNEDQYYRMERFTGAFSRRIPLPASTSAGEIAAEFRDGVLTVTVPRPEETNGKSTRIEVR